MIMGLFEHNKSKEKGSYEQKIEQLHKLVKHNSSLRSIAVVKLEELIHELESEEATENPRPEAYLPVVIPAVDKLRSGFNYFKNHVFRKNPELFWELSKGQYPKFLVIACSDSRVCPSTILDFKLGEAFVLKNIANMVPPAQDMKITTYPGVAAALEYAIIHLKVDSILVMGHSCCGGIRGLMSIDDDTMPSGFVEQWVKVCQDAKFKVKTLQSEFSFEDQCRFCEKEAINVSLGNLLTYNFIRERVLNLEVSLYGGYYDFMEGSFQIWSVDYNFTTPHYL